KYITVIWNITVPDRCGEPPSTALRSKLICCCFSRSSLFSKTSSTLLPFSIRIKYSFFSKMYF
uniref:Uncharacterized protein n=1 Tax=Hippocampus comes TaxID=109280 RepID=A0A3Q2YZB9_HIPCM